jgi:hypothetical protein
MTDTPQNPINLDLPRVVCPKHGEPFRTRWPKGYTIFALEGMRRLLARDDFHDEWKKVQDTNPALTRNECIERVLNGFPMCCRLGNKELMELYVDSEVGTVNRCINCKKMTLGTPYIILHPITKERIKQSHVCFSCLLYRMVPA